MLLSQISFAQNKSLLHKAWVKIKVENLSGQAIDPEPEYIRYTFTPSELKFSFYPAWDDYKHAWSYQDKQLTIVFDTYRVEELSDTSLVFALDGFRRFTFRAEDYLASRLESLDSIGQYNGKPLYKASNIITPRYKKDALRNRVEDKLDVYRNKKAAYFSATYVVTDEGKIENIQIINGLTEGFNEAFTRNLSKTSKNWKPAFYKGKPIQTQMSYEIKYLDSIVPYNTGALNE
jgi:hypothetical protein